MGRCSSQLSHLAHYFKTSPVEAGLVDRGNIPTRHPPRSCAHPTPFSTVLNQWFFYLKLREVLYDNTCYVLQSQSLREGTTPRLSTLSPWATPDPLSLVATSVKPVGPPPFVFLPADAVAVECRETVVGRDEETYTYVQDATTFLLTLHYSINVRARLSTYSNYKIRSDKR